VTDDRVLAGGAPDDGAGPADPVEVAEAWDEGLEEGHDPDMLANAALFTALSGLVGTYGESAVVELVRKLPLRILGGEFSQRTLPQ